MTRRTLLLILSLISLKANAQEIVSVPNYLRFEMEISTKKNILKSLDSLINQINKGKLDNKYITKNNTDLTIAILETLQDYDSKKYTVNLKIQNIELVNIYPIFQNKYSLSIASIKENTNSSPNIDYIINLIAEKDNGKIRFSIPLNYLTRHWKSSEIGNITYHFRDTISVRRAIIFNEKNTQIANIFAIQPEKLDFYMCDNYQEILKLQGFEYSLKSNGKYRDGYGVDSGNIFSIMDNEDFSHDIFHYYSGKVNDWEERNWISEEGLAYSLGNAYYTDENGEMIEQERLVNELKQYLLDNPNTDLWELFESNTRIFNHIAPEISVRYTISGIIATEVLNKKGKDGMLKLINCGRKNLIADYLTITDKLIGLNRNNFNLRVKELMVN